MDDGFTSEDSYLDKEIGIKEIALSQFRACCNEGSRHMDIPGQIDLFINSVIMLETILKPELIKQKEMVKRIEQNDEEINQLTQKYHHLQDNIPNNKAIKTNVYESRLLLIYRRRLIILSELLNELNYFGEVTAYG